MSPPTSDEQIAITRARTRWYFKFTKEELQQFAKARHIKAHDDSSKRDLMPLLVQDKESFARLQELPAEIRNIIYRFVLEPQKPSLHRPVEPSLTRVSRLVRKESLPIFYTINSFHLRLDRAHKLSDLGTWWLEVNGAAKRHINKLHLGLKQEPDISVFFTIDRTASQCIKIRIEIQIPRLLYIGPSESGAKRLKALELLSSEALSFVEAQQDFVFSKANVEVLAAMASRHCPFYAGYPSYLPADLASTNAGLQWQWSEGSKEKTHHFFMRNYTGGRMT